MTDVPSFPPEYVFPLVHVTGVAYGSGDVAPASDPAAAPHVPAWYPAVIQLCIEVAAVIVAAVRPVGGMGRDVFCIRDTHICATVCAGSLTAGAVRSA